MGVPALFRWLSKKYPKIIYPVVEDEEIKVPDENDKEVIVPINMGEPNPNGTEFDNLYLDMNGIVHPCTHPEGKPAPETEEQMMVEIFQYTERVVNMIRPRKLLFMAIDGVAPRAKMNQQRSRRFRAAQEAKDKEDARKESVLMWEAMGKELSDEEKNAPPPWDSNAITPGTPFMSLLATSLRYWVVKKMNSDPGWKQIQVIISDASVPGEGEHKIMDYIRRQRSSPGHDPNTQHVIYGLDADLIMLALATHEPYFRVLREDVFFQDISSTACRTCGQEGHYSAQCTGTKAEIQKKPPPEKKPFIFLDVPILREYLEVELNTPQQPFPFNLEQALDDWVLLIFFVGNDFLPHLPSLEIREGAIDTLLKIWKQELPRMGGYLTNHGHIELERAQIILEGLAKREDDIFRRRREAEERQDQNAKRRKIEMDNNKRMAASTTGPSTSLGLTSSVSSLSAASSMQSIHPSLPQKPNFAAKADSIGLGAPATATSAQNTSTATQALAGSNSDIVANRRAIRMANMSAAEVLKAELAGSTAGSAAAAPAAATPAPSSAPATPKIDLSLPAKPVVAPPSEEPAIPFPIPSDALLEATRMGGEPNDSPVNGESDVDVSMNDAGGADDSQDSAIGRKRKLEEMQEDDVVPDVDDVDDAPPPELGGKLDFKVNADGTVEQEDIVKLWEPGYKDRYYRQKFGVEPGDLEFRKKVTKSYIEGLCWVLHYYFQGTASWQWFYPYHFAPFAADFTEVGKMDIKFDLNAPVKPFEQLMSVFPAASRKHIPEAFHHLMMDDDSPILDFYPRTFEIDMNGKKMAWQGVALLPFIDIDRLLEEMGKDYPKISEEEVQRNQWGYNMLFASDGNALYPFYEALYGKRKKQDPVQLDLKLSKGMDGSVLPNPECIPGSTYYSPLESEGLPDVSNDRSLSVLYFFPPQRTPHRSMLLPNVKRPPRQLTAQDLENTRNGGGGRGRGRGRGGGGGGGGGGGFHQTRHTYDNNPNSFGADKRSGHQGGGYDSNDRGSYHGGGRGPPSNSYGNGGGSYGGGRERQSYPPGPPSSNSYGRGPPASYPPQPAYGGGGGGGYRDSRPPPSHRGGGGGGGTYGGYGNPPPASYGGGGGGYGGYGAPPPPPPVAAPSSGYGQPYGGSRGGYGGGGYGGGGGGGGGPYGGYGGYGAPPPPAPPVVPPYGAGYGRGGYGGGGGGGGRGGRGRGW